MDADRRDSWKHDDDVRSLTDGVLQGSELRITNTRCDLEAEVTRPVIPTCQTESAGHLADDLLGRSRRQPRVLDASVSGWGLMLPRTLTRLCPGEQRVGSGRIGDLWSRSPIVRGLRSRAGTCQSGTGGETEGRCSSVVDRCIYFNKLQGFPLEDVAVTSEELNPGSVEHEITRRRSDPCGCGEDKPATPTGTPRSRSVRNRRLSCMAVPLTLWGTAWGV